MSDLLGYILLAVCAYLAGVFLFVRFASFMHQCDIEARSIVRKKRTLRSIIRKPHRPKPRLKAA